MYHPLACNPTDPDTEPQCRLGQQQWCNFVHGPVRRLPCTRFVVQHNQHLREVVVVVVVLDWVVVLVAVVVVVVDRVVVVVDRVVVLVWVVVLVTVVVVVAVVVVLHSYITCAWPRRALYLPPDS